MTKNDGGSAFPRPKVLHPKVGCCEDRGAPGMSLRDYFAAAALPAVMAAYVEANGRCIGTDHVAYNCAAHAYRIADALLAERAKGGAP